MSNKKKRPSALSGLVGNPVSSAPQSSAQASGGPFTRETTSVGAVLAREERDATRGPVTTMLNPEVCVPWRLADRFEGGYDEASVADLVAEFKTIGQHTPVIARRLRGARAGEPQFEVVAGRRRLEAAKLAGTRLLAIVEGDGFGDQAAFLAMLSENDARKDITEFERAISFARAMEEGIFENLDQLIAHCSQETSKRRYSKGQISKMLTAATVREHPAIWRVLGSRRDVPVSAAYKLAAALSKSSGAADVAARRVETLGKRADEMDSSALIKDLLASLERSERANTKDPRGNSVAVAGQKEPVFWKRSGNEVVIRVPAQALTDKAALNAALMGVVDQAAK